MPYHFMQERCMKNMVLVLAYYHRKQKNPNRSRNSNNNGKWWQVMRASYIRSFYLPEHQPSPSSYSSHFKSRKPPHWEFPTFCDCGRKKDAIGCTHCSICQACVCVVECAQQQKLSEEVIAILKPIVCSKCDKRFPDKACLDVHFDTSHSGQTVEMKDNKASFKSLSVEQIKKLLKAKRLSTSGRKDILIRRLEGAASGDL